MPTSLPFSKAGRGLLDAVGAHGAQAVVGDELAALGVAVVPVHESVFLGLPVEALELVGLGLLAHRAEHPLKVVGEARRDEAVGHGLAGRVHIALSQPQPTLAVHRGKIHLASRRARQPDVAGLADLGRHDVHVDREQAALADSGEDRIDHGFLVAVGDRGHRVLHEVGPLLVGLFELVGVQRGLVVITGPDVMDAALSVDQQLVDIGRWPRAGIVGAHVAFLVAAEADNAAAHLADVAGRERDVHEGAVGPVVVVAPDEALLVAEHHAAALAALFRHCDPFGRLDDIGGVQAGDLGRLVNRHPAAFERGLEAGEMAGHRRRIAASRVKRRTGCGRTQSCSFR